MTWGLIDDGSKLMARRLTPGEKADFLFSTKTRRTAHQRSFCSNGMDHGKIPSKICDDNSRQVKIAK